MEDVLTSGSSNPNGDIYWTKIDELKKWKENNVYEPINLIGQRKFSTRWVVTEKYVKREKRTKAILAAREFGE